MRERGVPFKRDEKVSYFSLPNDLLRHVRKTKVVLFRASCEGKLRVAILENSKREGLSHRNVEIEAEMTLPQFYQIVKPGRTLVFQGKSEGVGIVHDSEPFMPKDGSVVFRVESIVCAESFMMIDPLSEGPRQELD